MKNKLQTILIKYLIRNLLNAVSIDDLLRNVDGKLFIGKRELTNEEVSTLKSEAKSFKSSLLWKLMLNNLYWIANFKMIKGANKERDMDGGRMMTLLIETLEEFLNKLTI